ncbi:MAG: FAD-dependent oxidoreductase [Pseudomonadota bacterium]
MMRFSDTIVIGGGLHGLSSALHLARTGQKVTLLEESWVGRHASGASAAGVRTLNRAYEELPISMEAQAMWHNIEALVDDHCGFHADGQIWVAERQADIARLQTRRDASRSQGFDHEELVGQAELRHLVPALAPHCVAALISRKDGAADPHRTIAAFRRSAEAAGVDILEGYGVSKIERTGNAWHVWAGGDVFAADTIVNAAGAWADRIAALIGDHFELGHKASMMMVTERISPFVKPVLSVVGRPLSFKQTSPGTIVIGGGIQGRADIAAQKSFVDFKGLAQAAKTATDLFQQSRPLRIVRAWTGMEAKPRDMLPVIGPSPQAPGIFHLFGFSGHGFQLVPVTGSIIADLITLGGTNRVISHFSPGRLLKDPVKGHEDD